MARGVVQNETKFKPGEETRYRQKVLANRTAQELEAERRSHPPASNLYRDVGRAPTPAPGTIAGPRLHGFIHDPVTGGFRREDPTETRPATKSPERQEQHAEPKPHWGYSSGVGDWARRADAMRDFEMGKRGLPPSHDIPFSRLPAQHPALRHEAPLATLGHVHPMNPGAPRTGITPWRDIHTPSEREGSPYQKDPLGYRGSVPAEFDNPLGVNRGPEMKGPFSFEPGTHITRVPPREEQRGHTPVFKPGYVPQPWEVKGGGRRRRNESRAQYVSGRLSALLGEQLS
jgi:hypothetical protein